MSDAKPMPDHSTCRNCGTAISWDEYSYTHDDTGFADCGIMFTGGTLKPYKDGLNLLVNPEITLTRHDGAYAEPREWGAPQDPSREMDA